MAGQKEYENGIDMRNWNRRIKRAMVQYTQLGEEKNFDAKKKMALSILELLYEKYCFDYELDEIILEDEQFEMLQEMEKIVENKPVYIGLEREWRQEISVALEQGKIVDLLTLIRAGQRFGYYRQPDGKNDTYYSEVKKIVNKIDREACKENER